MSPKLDCSFFFSRTKGHNPLYYYFSKLCTAVQKQLVHVVTLLTLIPKPVMRGSVACTLLCLVPATFVELCCADVAIRSVNTFFFCFCFFLRYGKCWRRCCTCRTSTSTRWTTSRGRSLPSPTARCAAFRRRPLSRRTNSCARWAYEIDEID